MGVHPLKGIGFCAGTAGLELGIHIAEPEYRTVCWVERDAYAAASLVARMEDKALDQAPIWSDLKTFDGKPWCGKVDILTAGYPCQPFSASGKQLGEEDPRHLWPYIKKQIESIRPTAVFCENVVGHLDRGFSTVATQLQSMGFRIEAGVFSAAEVGASQRRMRLFFLAYTDSFMSGQLARNRSDENGVEVSEWCSSGLHTNGGCGLDIPVQNGTTQTERMSDVSPFAPAPDDIEAWTSQLSMQSGMQPAVLREDDGIANRLDRYRLIGNGVLPLVAAHAWRTLTARVII
ncbi:MAG: DNA cytosine methyltransferase [Desulfovibrio sp.]